MHHDLTEDVESQKQNKKISSETLQTSLAIETAKITITMLDQIQYPKKQSVPYTEATKKRDAVILENYKKNCIQLEKSKSSTAVTFLKTVALIACTGMGMILGAAAGAAAGLLGGPLSIETGVVGAIAGAYAFGSIAEHFLFRPKKIIRNAIQVAENAKACCVQLKN